MFVQRQFKLISGNIDFQYVSSIDSRGYPVGYDKDIEHAVNLNEWQLKRVVSFFKVLGVKWNECL